MEAQAAEPVGGATPTPAQPRPPAPDRLLPKGLVLLLLALAALAYGDLLLWDPGSSGLPSVTWFFFGWADTSPQLLYGIAVLLLFRSRRRLAATLADPGAPLLALPLLLAGSLLFVWGRHVDALDLVLASSLLVSCGAALLLFGRRFAVRLLPALAVLAFAIPLPGTLSNHVVFPLQIAIAEQTAWLLNTAGVSAVAEGDLIQLAHGEFEVIESCSGLRAIQLLTLLGLAWSAFFHVPLRHALILIVVAPLIAYAINLGRVASLVLGSEQTLSHELQGVAAFVLGTLCLCAIDRGLLRLSPPPARGGGRAPPRVARTEAVPQVRRGRAVALAALLAALAAASFAPPWDASAIPRRARIELPERLGDWRLTERLEPDWMYLGVTTFADQAYARYDRDGEAVRVFVGYDDWLRRDRSLLSPKNGRPNQGWHVEERARLELEPGGPRLEALLAQSRAARLLTYHWYEGTQGMLVELLREALGLDQSVLRRPQGAFVVRVGTGVRSGAEARARADRRLREFALALRPVLRPAGD